MRTHSHHNTLLFLHMRFSTDASHRGDAGGAMMICVMTQSSSIPVTLGAVGGAGNAKMVVAIITTVTMMSIIIIIIVIINTHGCDARQGQEVKQTSCIAVDTRSGKMCSDAADKKSGKSCGNAVGKKYFSLFLPKIFSQLSLLRSFPPFPPYSLSPPESFSLFLPKIFSPLSLLAFFPQIFCLCSLRSFPQVPC